MSDNESRRRGSGDSDDRSYYSDSESYYSERSRNNGRDTRDEEDDEDKKSMKRGAFVFMGNAQDLRALKRGMKQKKVPMDIMNENKVKMSELRNKNIELLDLVSKYQFENRDLRRMLKRQEVHLKKIQLQEDSMPNLIERQSNETKSLVEQMRSLKERLKTQERKLKEADAQLDSKQQQLKQMNSLVHQKDLKKRQKLTQQLEDAQQQLSSKEENIRNLERHIDNMHKNHKHEMGLKKARQRASNEEVEDLRKEVQRLYSLMQEKEKESAVFNIYSLQHRKRPPHRLSSSIRSTPALQHLPRTDSAYKRLSKKSSFDDFHSKGKVSHRGDGDTKEDSKSHYAKGAGNNHYAAVSKDEREVEDKNRELEELERKIQQFDGNNTIGNNKIGNNNIGNNNKSSKSSKATGNKSSKSSKTGSKTKNNKNADKQKEALLERMKKVDDNKYQTMATTTSDNNNNNNNHNNNNNNDSNSITNYSTTTTKNNNNNNNDNNDNNPLNTFSGSNHNVSSIFADYKPSFLDDHDDDKPALRANKKDNLDFFSDDDNNNNNNNQSNSPVFLNLSSSNSNNSHLLPKRATQQDTSLATLNGIDSDEEVK